jgi:putative membrane protein
LFAAAEWASIVRPFRPPLNKEKNMNKSAILQRMAACASLAMLFSVGSAYAQTGTGTTAESAASTGAAASSGKKMDSADQRYMKDISQANVSEVATAKIALQNSQNQQVKDFAQKMIDDHGKAEQELQTLADSKGVKLPTEPDAKHKALGKMMSGLKGDAFDKRYIKEAGLGDHEKTIKLLQKVESKAKDPDLKAYAQKTMGPVKEHLAMAQDMASKHGQRPGSAAETK